MPKASKIREIMEPQFSVGVLNERDPRYPSNRPRMSFARLNRLNFL